MDVEQTIQKMARDAKRAAAVMARCDTARKNTALLTMADLLEQQAQMLFAENVFRDVSASNLSAFEFHLSAGVRVEAWGGSLAFGITENYSTSTTPPTSASTSATP